IARQALQDARVLSPGTRDASVGRSVGEMVGGLLCLLGGLGGEAFGAGASATGAGAAVGVPAMVVSAGLVTAGAGNMMAGLQGLLQAYKSPSSGGSGSSATPAPGAGAPKPVYKPFTKGNFPDNLAQRTGTMPKGADAHHVLPQRFRLEFEKRGINIHDPK